MVIVNYYDKGRLTLTRSLFSSFYKAIVLWILNKSRQTLSESRYYMREFR